VLFKIVLRTRGGAFGAWARAYPVGDTHLCPSYGERKGQSAAAERMYDREGGYFVDKVV